MFDIVQYEVQVFDHGHWHVRARYPRSDRDHAFMEARRIDLNEGLPTRVVRDVYDPQRGSSQEFIIFTSDRAKAAKTSLPGTARGKTARPGPKQDPSRRDTRPAPLAFRATMALGVGVVTALLVSAITTWAFAPQPESFASVLARSPTPGSMTLFLAVVLFSVFTMLRGPLGISRLARHLGAHFVADAAPVADLAPPVRPLHYTPPRPVDPTPPVAEHDNHVLSLSRVMLARFFSESAPVNATRALEDKLGRRGLALYLAGAASELATHLEMPSPADLMTQITPPILREAAEEMIAETRALGAADAALAAAGRSGMRSYVSTPDERPSMAAALVAWHKAVKAETTKRGA